MAMTRRTVVGAGAAASLAAQSAVGAPAVPRTGARADVVVVGAGVFGAWTAEYLRRAGRRVLLVDAQAPGHAASSSGGESRMTRAAYGPDRIYAEMALSSLAEWRALSDTAAPPLFHPIGVLFFFTAFVDYARASIETHQAMGLPLEVLDQDALAARWPHMDFAGVEVGLFEPDFGALMARRAVDTLVSRFVAGGGVYRQAFAEPDPQSGRAVRLNGERVEADAVVYACGPWLPKVFPELLGERIFVTRQEVAFLAPPDGDDRFGLGRQPGWAEFDDGDLYYGFPDLEGRGFKLAYDNHGPAFDPDSGDRQAAPDALDRLRAYLPKRFPALAARPWREFRVCQYENSASGDLLIDAHPTRSGAWLVGAGSGHGFKHGPAVGRMAADLVLGGVDAPHPRFTLASKATRQARAVH